MGYTRRDIKVIEGLEAIRRRPTMYLGEATSERTLCSLLVECVVGSIVAESPAPAALRLLLWSDGAVTVAYDGERLPIEARETRTGVAHPELYSLFMSIFGPRRPLQFGAAIVNALSEKLVVSTIHDGVRYRAAFSRGGLVSLLSKAPSDEPLGTNWLTFKPDTAIIPGVLDAAEAERIVTRVRSANPAVPASVADRSSEKPDWW